MASWLSAEILAKALTPDTWEKIAKTSKANIAEYD